MRPIMKLAAVALLGISAVSVSATAASAAVACNAEGACWHVKRTYNYRPEYGVTMHPNNWRWGAKEHYTWREHTGRGYWRKGAWVRF